jgi:predicted nucleic-acid-binding protein
MSPGRHDPAGPPGGELTAIDTNLLVRLLVADDAAQARRALAVVEAAPVWIAKAVLLETVWVLRSAYALDEARLRDLVARLFRVEGVVIEARAEVERAVAWWGEGLDFADALHLASAATAAATRLTTFDRAFARRARKISTRPPVEPV